MGADNFTHTAANTYLPVELQRRYVGKVSECFHFKSLLLLIAKNLHFSNAVYPANAAPTHAASATNSVAACSGIARRISFSTPDGEVNGVEPVKFIAR